MKKRVVVAMSGGVDSSVAAALLVKKGYEVIGVTMCFGSALEDLSAKHPACCGWDAIDDAKKVAAQLGIKHYVLNFAKAFKQKVIDDFLESYLSGETPNPCVRCNQFIKFSALFEKTKKLGSRFLATGHYACIEQDGKQGKYFIKKGKDASYDQSYFLYALKQSDLKHFLLPLGNITKKRSRVLARSFKLPVSEKPSSQEICFGGDDYRKFLKDNSKGLKAGPLKLSDGKVVGDHRGIGLYTVGQREGLGVALGKPQYVNRIDAESNTIFIGDRYECLFAGCRIKDINSFVKRGKALVDVMVKLRYNHTAAKAQVKYLGSKTCEIIFKKPQFAVTPGQSAVVYKGAKVLLGGIISKQIRK